MVDELFKLKVKEIVIDPKDLKIKIKEQTLFMADGGEGLHLWESSVTLSRYVISHKEILENKKVIELGCGCGLLGISALKKIPIEQYTFSDYNSSVLNNIKDNLKLNKITLDNKKVLLKQQDWKDYEKMEKEEYDVIIGSELIYKGGAILELSKFINRIMKPSGKCYISMPKQRQMTDTFLKYIENEGMKWKKLCFNDLDEEEKKYLFNPVLKEEKENKKYYENLSCMNIMLYEIYK